MKKILFIVLAFIFTILLVLNININSSKSGMVQYTSEAKAQLPCADKRCDFRHGESYGCSLTASGKDCVYTNNVCTGYEDCDGTNPQVD